MRVLAVASSGRLGGAELALATFLEHRPATVEAEAVVLGDGALPDRLASLGVPAHVARRYGRRPTIGQTIAFGRGLSRLLERRRPDVVLAVGQKAAVMAVGPCRGRRVPIVWNKVDLSRDATLAPPLAAAVNGTIAVSEAAARALGPLRRVRLLGKVPPPVRLDAPAAAVPRGAGEPPVVGMLARLVPYKGQELVVAAAARLVREFPDLRVVLAGDTAPEHPSYAEELRARAAALGVGDRVELPGFVPSAAEFLGGLSVYVSATHRDEAGFGLEGLSVAVLEASLAGLPVVAVAGGGAEEALVHGVTGTLVPRPDPEAIAAAVAPYLRDPEAARAAGAAGREFVRAGFAADAVSARLWALLERSLGDGGARRVRTVSRPRSKIRTAHSR